EVPHTGGELVPDVLAELVAPVLLHRFLHPLAELVVGLLAARRADDGEAVGEQPAVCERVQRRHPLSLGQIAGGAKDDHDARLRPPLDLQAREQRVGLDRDPPGASRTTRCPPNSLRRAAFTFAANDSSWRDAKRAKSAAVITGTGTSSAIASAIVHR